MSTHMSHPEIVNRLKRANGHLLRIIEMIEVEAPCLEIAQQLQAVVGGVNKAKETFIRDHIEHCMDDVSLASRQQTRQVLAEFKEITKYL